jgi:hypothetical protein
MALFGHVVMSNRQNKVSSCRIVHILHPTTMHSLLGNFAHEGQYRQNFVIVDEVGMDAGGTSNR